MTCEEARDVLLEVGTPALEGVGETPLAAHVRSCPRCRALARALLDDTEALGRELDARVRRAGGTIDPARVLERAGVGARRRDEPRPTGRWRTVARTAVPLAAAAALAALLLWGRGSDPTDAPPRGGAGVVAGGPEATTEPGAPLPEVGASGQGTVAVFETEDPEITVVWFFPEEG